MTVAINSCQSNLVGFTAGDLRVCLLFVRRARFGRSWPLLNAGMNTVRSQVFPVSCDLWLVIVLTKVYCECQAAWCSRWNCSSWLSISFITTALFRFCYMNNPMAMTPTCLTVVNNIPLCSTNLVQDSSKHKIWRLRWIILVNAFYTNTFSSFFTATKRPKSLLILKHSFSFILFISMLTATETYSNAKQIFCILFIDALLAKQHLSLQWTVDDKPCDETFSAVDPTPILLLQLDLLEFMSLSGGVWDRDMSVTWEPVLTAETPEKADGRKSIAVCP